MSALSKILAGCESVPAIWKGDASVLIVKASDKAAYIVWAHGGITFDDVPLTQPELWLVKDWLSGATTDLNRATLKKALDEVAP